MIEQLPEGKNIGRMQAPPQWIFTHTARFAGIVRVVIPDGEGFILIRKGKPLVHYFRHGRIVLCGEEALEYFKSQPTIEFNLCKYTTDELSLALKICNIDEIPTQPVAVPGPAPAVPAPESNRSSPPPGVAGSLEERVAAETKRPSPRPGIIASLPEVPVPETGEEPEEDGISLYEDPGSRPVAAELPVTVEEPDDTLYEDTDSHSDGSDGSVPAPRYEVPVPDKGEILPPADPDDPDIRIIGQIRKLNGIVAVLVFNKDRSVLLMGDAGIEPLLVTSRSMLATAGKIIPHLDWGLFSHMTLQVPDGNVIIAPYHEDHLCILTTRTINIGHIRRILRDFQKD